MSALTILLFVLGIALLVLGAELLVRGASRLALAAGVSPLVVGLTVVAFGTSAPELAVSVRAAVAGSADIAYGNVVGSNIFNVLFILGLSALVAPLLVDRQLIRRDVPIMVGVSLLLPLLALDGKIGRIDGALLFGGILAYTAFSVIESRKERSATREEMAAGTSDEAPGAWWANLLLVVGGVGMLVLGARWLVDGAVVFARALGVSELIIGLTIVAAGTSLPEVATSVLASIRGHRDIAVGNVVGSNIFNILCVLGLTGLVAPGGVPVSPDALAFDTPVMIGVALACLPIFFVGPGIARWEGALFLFYYAAYVTFIVLEATDSTVLPTFQNAMVFFALPLTAVTLLVLAARAWHRGRTAAP
ncbi:MAG: calcium/sodium antiporter [Thermoanaerobaculia bacterium]|nr:calcium/sodium antiporter [Thermoanaerobaculia bacterium]